MKSLIVDSGATSTKWCLESESISEAYYTEGLNPYYHTSQSITGVINTNLLPKLKEHDIDEIHFYGAGCDNPEQKATVHRSLKEAFPNSEIEVEHDLLGSARACFFDQPGIACILGTGSNSCLYNGKKIIEHIPSLAFTLGDEGSAGYFGKKLLNSYFRYEVPADLKEKLDKEYNMDLDYIMANIYEGKQPSRFVASYARFLGDFAQHPFARDILREGFENFINRIIKKYSDAESYEVSFVGSVASAHKKLITEILEEGGLTAGSFYRNPLDRLIAYHTN